MQVAANHRCSVLPFEHIVLRITLLRSHLALIARALLIVAWCMASQVDHAFAAPPCVELGRDCPLSLQTDNARGVALGTGVRATATSNSAVLYNPAALVLTRAYHVEGTVDYMPDRHTVALGGNVADSLTSRVAAGLAVRGFLGGDRGLGGIDGRLALGLPLSDAVSIGVSARYLNVSHDDAQLDPGGKAKGFTLDASLRVSPIPSLQLYVGGFNLIDRKSAYAPVLVGGGAGLTLGDLAVIGADVLVDLSSFRRENLTFGAGLELLASQPFPIRVGYQRDSQREQNTLSFGIGYSGRQASVDLSMRQDLGGANDTRFMGGVRIDVQ